MCPPENGQWSDWEHSDAECEFIAAVEKWIRVKSRKCSEPKYGGLPCSPDPETNETETGYTVCDAINGKWSSWEFVDESSCSLNPEGI